jgi:hypothetical protein
MPAFTSLLPALLGIGIALWYLRRSYRRSRAGSNGEALKPVSKYERGGKSSWNQLNEGEDPTL